MEENKEIQNMATTSNVNHPIEDIVIAKHNTYWDTHNTSLLISYYKTHCAKVKQCKITLKKMWQLIAEKMKAEHDISFSSDMLENRWRVLIRKYKKVKESESSSSRRTRSFPFQNELEDVFKKISVIEDEFQNQTSDVFTLSELETDSLLSENEPLYNYVTWDTYSTKCLIKCWKFYRPEVLTKTISNKEMWNLVSEKLKAEYNLDYLNACCENRARVLRRSYEKFLLGTRQKYFDYEREMAALYKNVTLSEYFMNSTKDDLEASISDISDIDIPPPHSEEPKTEKDSKTFEYKMWRSKATKLLLYYYKYFHPKIGTNGIKNIKKMWEVISSKLKEHNLNYSSNACENRWRVLLRNYEAVHNGKRKKFFEFTSDMNEICGKKFKKAYQPNQKIKTMPSSGSFIAIEELQSSNANLRQYFQTYQQKNIEVMKQSLEQSRKRTKLLEEKNKILKQFIVAVANPFHEEV